MPSVTTGLRVTAGITSAIGRFIGDALANIAYATDFLSNQPLSSALALFSRTTAKTTTDYLGRVVECLPGELPMHGGRRVENILSDTDELATQSVSGLVIGAEYTLAFDGSGSVALSVGASGSLAGDTDRVSLTFEPTGPSVTFTVTGEVLNAQLERFDSASEYVSRGVPTRYGVELISNGRFESGDATGWEIAGDGVLSVDNRVGSFSTTSGTGHIGITFTTVPGRRYLATFGVENVVGAATIHEHVRTTMGGGNLVDQSATTFPSVKQYDFVATTTTTYLHFAAGGGSAPYSYDITAASCQEVAYDHGNGNGVDGVKWFDTGPFGNDLREGLGPELWPLPYNSVSDSGGSDGVYNLETSRITNSGNGTNGGYPRIRFDLLDSVGKTYYVVAKFDGVDDDQLNNIRLGHSGGTGENYIPEITPDHFEGVVKSIASQNTLELGFNGTKSFDIGIVSFSIREVYPVPLTGVPLETAATNILPTVDNWSVSNLTVTSDELENEGETVLITAEDSGTDRHCRRSLTGIQSETDYTLRVAVYDDSTSPWMTIRLIFFTNAANDGVWFDIANGVFGAVPTGVVASAVPIPNGYELTFVVTTKTGVPATTYLDFGPRNANESTATTTGHTIRVENNPSLELGNKATSRVRTTTAAVTRTADLLTVDGSQFDEVNGWSMVAVVKMLDGSDGAADQHILRGISPDVFVYNHTDTTLALFQTGDSIIGGGGWSAGEEFIVGAKISTDRALYKNGVELATDPSSTIPDIDSMQIGADANMVIKSFAIFPADADLSILTDPTKTDLSRALANYRYANALKIPSGQQWVVPQDLLENIVFAQVGTEGLTGATFSIVSGPGVGITANGGLFISDYSLFEFVNQPDFAITVQATADGITKTNVVTVSIPDALYTDGQMIVGPDGLPVYVS